MLLQIIPLNDSIYCSHNFIFGYKKMYMQYSLLFCIQILYCIRNVVTMTNNVLGAHQVFKFQKCTKALLDTYCRMGFGRTVKTLELARSIVHQIVSKEGQMKKICATLISTQLWERHGCLQNIASQRTPITIQLRFVPARLFSIPSVKIQFKRSSF